MSLREFDSSGTRLGQLGADGQLAIWCQVEGKAASLAQKFSTSSHLAAAPTCLAWARGDTHNVSTESQLKVNVTLAWNYCNAEFILEKEEVSQCHPAE